MLSQALPQLYQLTALLPHLVHSQDLRLLAQPLVASLRILRVEGCSIDVQTTRIEMHMDVLSLDFNYLVSRKVE